VEGSGSGWGGEGGGGEGSRADDATVVGTHGDSARARLPLTREEGLLLPCKYIGNPRKQVASENIFDGSGYTQRLYK